MKTSRKASALTLYVIVIGLFGCTSIQSTFPQRGITGKFVAFCMPHSTKGVPCKLKVQTAVQATITEEYFVNSSTGQTLVPDKRLLSVSVDPVHSDQLFLVHVPRPLAGTLDLSGTGDGYQLDENGYLTGLGVTKIEDKTLDTINEALGDEQLGGLFKSARSLAGADWIAQTRTLASCQFSLADPDWHHAMNQWISDYLSHCVQPCHDCNVQLIETIPMLNDNYGN